MVIDSTPRQVFSRIIKLGIRTRAAPVEAFESASWIASDWAKDIVCTPGFTISAEQIELRIVCRSVGDLGLGNGANLTGIYAAAQKFGLGLCPAEAGPQLRQQYLDQPVGEWLRIAMTPIPDSEGDLRLFRIGHCGSRLWLRTDDGYPGLVWRPDSRFAFVDPN
jgi:hypothetical protein